MSIEWKLSQINLVHYPLYLKRLYLKNERGKKEKSKDRFY